jgi:hypothetical protein
MNPRLLMIILPLFTVFLGACASLEPVPLDPQFWQQQTGKKVGVALMAYPPAETIINEKYVYGGRLQAPIREHKPVRFTEAMRLLQAAQAQGAGEFSPVQDLFVDGLKNNGFIAFKVDQPIDQNKIPKFKGIHAFGTYENRDYREFGKDAAADYLILTELVSYGPACHYIDINSDYTEVRAHAQAELLDVETNHILWRTGWSQGDFIKPVDASCSRPEQIPIIMDALKNLLGDAASSLSHDFFSQSQDAPR